MGAGEQCWRSGESTGLPPMWPGFDSWIGRHMWVEFVGYLLCSKRFFPSYSGFPLSPKTNIRFYLCWFDFLSPQLVEPLCLAKYTWDINKVIIIIIIIIITSQEWYYKYVAKNAIITSGIGFLLICYQLVYH